RSRAARYIECGCRDQLDLAGQSMCQRVAAGLREQQSLVRPERIEIRAAIVNDTDRGGSTNSVGGCGRRRKRRSMHWPLIAGNVSGIIGLEYRDIAKPCLKPSQSREPVRC